MSAATTSEMTPRKRWWQREESRAMTVESLPVSMVPSTAAGQPVTARSALGIADVFACVRALVDAVATLPLHPYRHGAGGRERVEGELSELLWNPAPAVTQASFLGHLMTSLVLHGDGFIALYRDGDGEVIQVGVLHPDRVQVRVVGGMPFYDVSGLDGTIQTVTERDVIHVRSPLSLDGVRGLSPIAACRESLGLAEALTKQASATARNDGRPAGVLRVKGNGAALEETLNNVASGWAARHSGPENSGRIAVLAAEEVDFSPISMPAADQQFIEQLQASTATVARIFRIPPFVIGAPSGDSLTYSTVEGQGLAFLTYSLRPWLTCIEQALSASVLCLPGVYVEFTTAALLSVDTKTRAETYAIALDKGWLTVPEVRERENLPALAEVLADAA